MKPVKPSNKEDVIYQPFTMEELIVALRDKNPFKEQIARAAERVRKVGLPTQPKPSK